MTKITKISMEVPAGAVLENSLRQAYHLSDMNNGAVVEIMFNGVRLNVKQTAQHDDDTKRDRYLMGVEQSYQDELDVKWREEEARKKSMTMPVADALHLAELASSSQKRGRWTPEEALRANKIVTRMAPEYQERFRSLLELPLKAWRAKK